MALTIECVTTEQVAAWDPWLDDSFFKRIVYVKRMRHLCAPTTPHETFSGKQQFSLFPLTANTFGYVVAYRSWQWTHWLFRCLLHRNWTEKVVIVNSQQKNRIWSTFEWILFWVLGVGVHYFLLIVHVTIKWAFVMVRHGSDSANIEWMNYVIRNYWISFMLIATRAKTGVITWEIRQGRRAILQ